MPKGQLSRVPWPGSCRRLFTFQAVLRPLQQTHKHSCSLHLAIQYSPSDSPSLHSISQNSFLLKRKKKKSVQTNLQSTARPHQSTDLKLERAASRIKERSPPCLFRLPPWENVNRSITLNNCMRVMSSH